MAEYYSSGMKKCDSVTRPLSPNIIYPSLGNAQNNLELSQNMKDAIKKSRSELRDMKFKLMP
jgi:hypothetical protein